MADDKKDLPEGTDRIIAGASAPTVSNTGAVGIGGGDTGRGDTKGREDDETLTISGTQADVLVVEDSTETTGGAPRTTATTREVIVDKIRSGREKLSSQAADKTRGLVGQGLERGAEALANVGKLVGDTADGLDERLGPEYGDYARKAATAIEDAANSLASKDADELIDDTREFVRKSPGVALAGAAIVGFALARLIKSGLARDEDDSGDEGGRRTRGKRES
jgi:ElaB/YqjD/DUF883 family membrane-anchored ribosome-binding protein